MNYNFLISIATSLLDNDYVKEYLSNLAKALSKRSDLTEEQKLIIQKLLIQALSKGVIQDHNFGIHSKKASGGVATELVTLNSANIRFAIKIDSNEKLIREAMILEYMSYRPELPKGFSNHFPKIYALKKDKPPYAYIMQAFDGTSFSEHIFKGNKSFDDLKKTMSEVLNILIPAYRSSKNDNLCPNIEKLYIDRIFERLKAACNVNKDFDDFTKKSITINSEKYDTPESYLTIIQNNIDKFSAKFSTFVHGDCHLGNIIVNYLPINNKKRIEVKFIDTRDWYESDYIFDIAKIVQYLKIAGPAEATLQPVKVNIDVSNGTIDYSLNTDDKVKGLIKVVRQRIIKFAKETGDANWFLRYKLAVASVLLGLHINRIKSADKKKTDVAFIMYSEGLKYLSEAANMKMK